MKDRLTRATRQKWASAMVELLGRPVNEAGLRKVLRVIGADQKPQEAMDV